MKLHELSPAPGARRGRNRVGRGVGSGWGKTSGRGTKGQNSRSGGGVRPGYEGGQMPIHRRLPKRGFRNLFRKQIAIVNLEDLSGLDRDTVVDIAALARLGLLKGVFDGVKLLGQGEVQQPLTVRLDLVSQGARKKIEAAGGKIEEI